MCEPARQRLVGLGAGSLACAPGRAAACTHGARPAAFFRIFECAGGGEKNTIGKNRWAFALTRSTLLVR